MAVDSKYAPLAVLLLRIALGIMFIAHGLLLKFFVFTLPGSAQFFDSIGLPGWLAYVVFAMETAGGIMLVLGIQARWVALVLAPIPAAAVIWVHWDYGWLFTNENGGWEYPAYMTILAVAQFMLGDGAYALIPSRRVPGSERATHSS